MSEWLSTSWVLVMDDEVDNHTETSKSSTEYKKINIVAHQNPDLMQVLCWNYYFYTPNS